MRRVAIVAASYEEARAFANELDLREEARVSLVAPTTHPGAIACTRFDEVVRLDDVDLDPRTEEHLTKNEERLKEGRA